MFCRIQLIESSMSAKFVFSQYEDRYTDQLKELINTKIAGREVIEPPQAEEYTPVINLMDALRKKRAKHQTVAKGELRGRAKIATRR